MNTTGIPRDLNPALAHLPLNGHVPPVDSSGEEEKAVSQTPSLKTFYCSLILGSNLNSLT